MECSKTNEQSFALESLEPRILLSATPQQIADALDLPAGTVVTYAGNPASVAYRDLHNVGGLQNFPTGPDSDFLILSTGDASWVDTVANTGPGIGLALTGDDAIPDWATIQFTLAVPASPVSQELQIDFLFFSEEFISWQGSEFNDTFTLVFDGMASVYSVDGFGDDYLTSEEATAGTFFDARARMISFAYPVPAGATTVDVVINLTDLGDGLRDTAVLLDNVRFVPQQVVYLNFDGADVNDLFGYGTSTVLPAFQTSDLRRYEPRAEVINEIVAGLEDRFSDYNIRFVTTPPVGVAYLTVVIGGKGSTAVMLDPIVQKLIGLPAITTIDSYFGNGVDIQGMADTIDIGNQNNGELTAVLSGKFGNYTDPTGFLVTRISHEIGHALGLRHVTNTIDIMTPTVLTPTYEGYDLFNYIITDDEGNTSSAKVYLAVGNIPLAVPDEAQLPQNSPLVEIPVLANDLHGLPGEVMVIFDTTSAVHGTVLVSLDGLHLYYQPDVGYVGNDSFTYTVIDTLGKTNTTNVSVVIGLPIPTPTNVTAYNDYFVIPSNSGPVTLNVLDNDYWPQGPARPPTITAATQGMHGNVVIEPDTQQTVSYQPDSQDFQNASMALSETWYGGGPTTQNDYEYLAGWALGLAGGGYVPVSANVVTNIDPVPFTFVSPITLYKVTIGIYNPGLGDIPARMVYFDKISAGQPIHTQLDIYTTDAKIFLTASTSPRGKINVVSGTPTLAAGESAVVGKPSTGTMTYDDIMLSFMVGGQMIPNIPLAKAYGSNQFREIYQRKTLAAVTVQPSDYLNIQWLKNNKGTFTDDDGDVYTVSLSKGGMIAVVLDDPDGDGNGPIKQILISDSTDKSTLTVTVRKAAGGDGLVTIGDIYSTTLKSINIAKSNVVGRGIDLTDVTLGSLTVNDFENGANLFIGGTYSDLFSLKAHVIGDATWINSGSLISNFQAAFVGAAQIEAPGITTMMIKGDAKMAIPADFSAEVTLQGHALLNKTINKVTINNDLTDSSWSILSGLVSSFIVKGTATGLTFTAAGDVGTMQFGQLIGSNIYVGIRPLFTALPGSDAQLPSALADFNDVTLSSLKVTGLKNALPGTFAFEDSYVSARRIKSVSLQSLNTNNGGVLFGLSSDEIDRFSIASPKFSASRLKNPAQSIVDDDFNVLIV